VRLSELSFTETGIGYMDHEAELSEILLSGGHGGLPLGRYIAIDEGVMEAQGSTIQGSRSAW
jgi:hypothetical protein